MIVLDTSALVESLTGDKRTAAVFRRLLDHGERMLLPSVVLYEWLRGPRLDEELRLQEALLPADSSIPFGADEAKVAAALYGSVARPRGREVDLAIAACAIARGAELWTTNPRDFEGIPRLRLYRAPAP